MIDRPDWMPSITACVALIVSVAMIVASRAPRIRAAWLAVALLAVLGWRYAPALLVFLPPALLNFAFGMYFATTLAPGREPRIATFARLERGGDLPPDLVAYTRSLTLLWAVLLFALALIGMLLAAFAPLETWSAFVNVASYLAIGALFVGEYAYRRARFAHHRHASLAAMVKIVARERRSAATGSRSR